MNLDREELQRARLIVAVNDPPLKGDQLQLLSPLPRRDPLLQPVAWWQRLLGLR